MEGYIVKLSFLIGGHRTFNTLGLANSIFRHQLSGPMYVIGSCISNFNIPIVDKWFGFIVPECNCSVANAIQNIRLQLINRCKQKVYYVLQRFTDCNPIFRLPPMPLDFGNRIS